MFEIICTKRKEDGKNYSFVGTKKTKEDAMSLAARLKKNGYINIKLRSRPDTEDYVISDEDSELVASIYEKDNKISGIKIEEDEEY